MFLLNNIQWSIVWAYYGSFIYSPIFGLVSIWSYNKNVHSSHKYPYTLFSVSLLEEKAKTQKSPRKETMFR